MNAESDDLLPLDAETRAIAEGYGVSPQLHRHDYIFQALLEHFHGGDVHAAAAKYFLIGDVNAGKIAALVERYLGRERLRGGLDIADFASGYGCVTRHLAKALPSCRFAAIDIHEQAVAFTRSVLATPAHLSHRDPALLDLGGRSFDVVFALSFFSHVPRVRFLPWLRSLSALVREGGLLIFTTHGRVSHGLMPEIRVSRDGFGFRATSEQKDLPTSDYGMTVSYPEFVLRALRRLEPDVRLVCFSEAEWWTHQDGFVLQKTADPKVQPAFAWRKLLPF